MTKEYDNIIRNAKRKRMTRARAQQRSRAKQESRAYRPRQNKQDNGRIRRRMRPFVGVDGEGGGVNEHGQQNYLLLRAGDRVLFNDNKPLRLAEICEFILSLPRNNLYVGYAFGYDSSQILRDLPPAYVERLFWTHRERKKQERELGHPISRYTAFGPYGIEYTPGQLLRICRLDERNKPVPNSHRTIYETIGFFQRAFVKAVELMDIGTPEQRAEMAGTKGERGSFVQITPEIDAYNQLEINWLEQMMERLRELCVKAQLLPPRWSGPGQLAAAALKQHNTLRRDELPGLIPADVLQMAKSAYYGARAEMFTYGLIDKPVYGYDLKSAYPYQMTRLPCLRHARWHQCNADELSVLDPATEIFVADLSFHHPKGAWHCGFPWRDLASRGLSWPRMGRGTYWSPEIAAAQTHLSARIRYHGGWRLETTCDCQPFAWVADMYRERKRLEAAGDALAMVWKLVLNSLYGKLAQRKGGGGPYQCHVWAGLITAMTRAMLIEAIATAKDPRSIVMVATDAIYSVEPLPLDRGERLGQWGCEVEPWMFLAQSGVYWGEKVAKTRGMPVRDLKPEVRAALQAKWAEYVRLIRFEWAVLGSSDVPVMPIPRPRLPVSVGTFIGLRLAHARNAHETACRWETVERRLSFNWELKRAIYCHPSPAGDDAVMTQARDGALNSRSADWFVADDIEDRDTLRAYYPDMAGFLAEGQPDFLDYPGAVTAV